MLFKKRPPENFLEKIPSRNQNIAWVVEDEIVTLEILNKGATNRLAQLIWHTPKKSFVNLDIIGSYIWPRIDGEKNIYELGQIVEKKFGSAASPLYERLTKHFRVLESYGWVEFK